MTDQTHFEKFHRSPGENAGSLLLGRLRRKAEKLLLFGACLLFAFGCTIGQTPAKSQDPGREYLVKHVYSGVVYIDAGGSTGLEEGQRLTIRRRSEGQEGSSTASIGQVEIESVAATSAAGKIVFATSEILPGDLAYSEPASGEQITTSHDSEQEPKLIQMAAVSAAGRPAQTMSTTSTRPVPRESNLVRGRFGVDYSALQVSGSDASSSQFGFFLRMDASRLGGTYWNVRGYYRGRFQKRTNSAGQETLNDLINRTYHLNVTYENPNSNWVFGGGRLYVPWASSLSTLDGFYLGRKFGRQTAGVFMGTTPDPTSWNYSVDRQMGGAFYNIQGGSFESIRIDSTAGIALSRIDWKPDRQFGFFENNFFYKRYISVYSNIEADLLTGAQNHNQSEVVLSRSYVTVRIQPHKVISFNVNHNYFKNIPTFDTRLIGTGLLDEFLFQGFSAGFRLSLPYRLGLFANAGGSNRTGDERDSWTYLAGGSASNILNSGIRLAYRFSKFDSNFGRGTYQSLSVSRDIAEILQFEVQGGRQDFKSSYTRQDLSWFINGNVDWFLGRKFFLGGGATVYRGDIQSYNQFFVRLGYRFDNRRGGW